MAPDTHLPGKDASLEATIGRASTLLQGMGIATEPVSWQNPAPECWSVHLRSTSCSHLYTNGKGVSKMAALASALGEFIERLATNFFFADCFLDEGTAAQPFLFYPEEKWFPPGEGTKIPTRNRDACELLSAPLRKLYNPEGELTFEHLCDNNSNSLHRGICALPFTDMATGRKIYFPVSLLNNLYVSNGMAAGNSRPEGTAQALSEIIERYVKNIIISKGLSLPDIPGSVLGRFPRLVRIIKRLGEEGLMVRVKDGSLGGRFPVICALLSDSVNGGAYAAFGANLRLETAIERTLTELLQGRSLESLKHFQPPGHDLSQIADPFNLESHFVDSDGLLAWSMFRDKADFPFSPWDFQGSTVEESLRLQAIITGQNIQLYRAEYLHCGMYSCRIIAPGMSEIYPLDDLLYNNRSSGASLRDDILKLPSMQPEQLAALYDRLEFLGISDQQLLSDILGIIFEEDSTWRSLRIGELKAQILLAMHSHREAMHWCGWCLDHADLPAERRRLYRLLHTLLGFSLEGEGAEEYRRNLAHLYRADELRTARLILEGEVKFPGLHFGASWSEISEEHNALLQLYRRLNTVKAAAREET